jgi:acylphosphatase
MNEKCVHVAISGRVQGVGFRAWMARRASQLALRGWVRNRPDGRVEAVLQGPSDMVDRMIGLCREGPRHSVVADVEISSAANENWPDFSVRPTG